MSSATVATATGTVYGYSFRSTSPYTTRTFVWTQSSGLSELSIGGGRTRDVNAQGTLVGGLGSLGPGGLLSAYAWNQDTGLRSLNCLHGDNYSFARGINNAGGIVGTSNFVEYPNTYISRRAVHWATGSPDPEVLSDLPGGDDFSEANEINDSGVIVGYGSLQEGRRAIRWLTGSSPELLAEPDVAYTSSCAYDINNTGQIVGSFSTTQGSRALVWNVDGSLTYLDQMLDASGMGWRLDAALGINDLGQIVGSGVNPAGVARGFVLTPVPEPGSGIALICLLGFLATHRTAARSHSSSCRYINRRTKIEQIRSLEP